MATTERVANSSLRVGQGKVRRGDLVHVKYLDHVLYKDSDESKQTPRLMEAYGRLSYEDDQYIRVRFEDYPDPDPSPRIKERAMGLVIVKSTILELRRADVGYPRG